MPGEHDRIKGRRGQAPRVGVGVAQQEEAASRCRREQHLKDNAWKLKLGHDSGLRVNVGEGDGCDDRRKWLDHKDCEEDAELDLATHQ